MAKSAMEALNRRFEEESGDTNVDIEVIVNADGEAAEDIIEATDAGEQAAEDVAISQENEEATQEASDMAELATVLRKHGLTPGMAAVLKITVPLAAYGITLPAMESLDSSGRNQAVADRIANRLEAAVEEFWNSAKNFFYSLWNRIVQAFQWICNRVGSIKSRVMRAHASIDSREWDDDLAKGRKFKEIKEQDKCQVSINNIGDKLAEETKKLKDETEEITGKTKDQNGADVEVTRSDSVAKDIYGKGGTQMFSDEDLKNGLGYKLNEKGTGLEKDSTAKPELNEVDADRKHLDYCKKTGFENTKKICDRIEDFKGNLAQARSLTTKASKRNKEAGDDKSKSVSAQVRNLRDKLNVFSSVLSKWTAVANKLCMVYVKQCSMIRLCTRGGQKD